MKNTNLLISVILILLVVGAVNILSTVGLKGVRADLTEKQLFTLTPGTRNIVSTLEEPITLQYYFSRKVAQAEVPGIITYATRVQEVLEEYTAMSKGKIKLVEIDPIPFSVEEEEAAAAGLESQPINQLGDRLFLGLVAKNSVDQTEIIPFFDRRREAYLEYDLTKIIYNLNNSDKPVLGLITELPLAGEQDPMVRFSNPEAAQPWIFYQQLREFYDVRDIDALQPIPADVDLLLVVHPKGLPEVVQYHIDQFILSGRNALIYVDPHADAEVVPQDPQNPMAAMFASKASSLGNLETTLGLILSPDVYVADEENALTSQFRDAKGIVSAAKFIHALTLDPATFTKDVTTEALEQRMNFIAAGNLAKKEDATTEFTPLIQSGKKSMLMPVDEIKISPNPDTLLKNFKSEDKNHTLAVRISGTTKTAFPERVQESSLSKEEHLAESKTGINVIVVSDVDTLTDRLWVQRQRMFGQEIAIPVGSNGTFGLNALENLAGNNDLISIRSRGVSERPFTVFVEIAKSAGEKFQKREQELQTRLEEITTQIQELSQTNDGTLSLTAEVKTRQQEAQEEFLKARRELREVQLNLNQDVEKLQTRLMLLNVLAVPGVVVLVAIILSILRIQRRRKA
jgi:ABC-type uncharacterized transport system involved in gliding motility auxiliary subunit